MATKPVFVGQGGICAVNPDDRTLMATKPVMLKPAELRLS